MKFQKVMKNSLRRVMAAFTCLLLLAAPLSISAAGSQSWYVRRNPDHKQPVLEREQQFIERCGGYYVDRTHGDNSEEKVIYLTFDVGYENGNVAAILDTLKKENVKGAFFVLQHMIEAFPALIRRMSDEGHLVCNHTMRHKNMTAVDEATFKAEINGLADSYEKLTGKPIAKYYRPPRGEYDEKSLLLAESMGYKTIFWSFAYADWDNGKQAEVTAAKKKIRDNMHNGAVILLHPTSKTNMLLLPEMIREWKAEGYRFGTLDELTGK